MEIIRSPKLLSGKKTEATQKLIAYTSRFAGSVALIAIASVVYRTNLLAFYHTDFLPSTTLLGSSYIFMSL